jgi:hypothetical protein
MLLHSYEHVSDYIVFVGFDSVLSLRVRGVPPNSLTSNCTDYAVGA